MTIIKKTALVTGAAKGIGFGITQKLVESGFRVVMVDMDEQALTLAAAKFPTDTVLDIAIDITEQRAPETIQAVVNAKFTPISVLVNNAAISPKHDGVAAGLVQISEQEWSQVFCVNVMAPMRLAKCFVPYMKANGWGRVINISSRAGRSHANAAGPAYMSSKAAILGLTRSIASEFAADGITSNSVAPGLVETDLALTISPQLLAAIRSKTPVGRGGKVTELGAVVAFLASEDAAFITGACIDVNGGAFMC